MPDTYPYPSTPARAGRWGRQALAGPVISLILLAATGMYWVGQGKHTELARETSFQREIERIVEALQDRLLAHELVLRGFDGFYTGSTTIDRAEFQTYAQAVALPTTLPGMLGVTYVLPVPATELADHERDMRARGFPNYAVRPAGLREAYRPLTLIEPQTEDNLRVVGMDTAMVPEALAAQNRARDTGEPSLTARLLLRQDLGEREGAGAVLYVPIYAPQMPLTTVHERRMALRGWVSGPFRMREFVEGIGRVTEGDLALAIYDGPLDQPGSALYTSPHFESKDVLGARVRTFSVAGRIWTVLVHPLAGFDQRFHADSRDLIALLAAVLSLGVGVFVWFLSRRRDHAQAVADGMTQALRGARDDLQATLDATPDWMFELDGEGRVLRCHNAPQSTLHAQAVQLVGRKLTEAALGKTAFGLPAAIKTAAARGYSMGHELQLEIDGESRWFELSIARKQGLNPAHHGHFIALLRDVSERKLAAQRTHRLAYFDALTELPNRRMLIERMVQSLGAATLSGQLGAVIFLDLDNFKHINDAQGHPAGDRLLRLVAQRLTHAMQGEGDTVAHIGGDEFVVLLTDLADRADEAALLALRQAERLRAALEEPYSMGDQDFAGTVSMGLTLFPKNGESVEDLLREADTAMYRAKELGRNRVCLFEASMQANVQRRLALEQDLKSALVQQQISAFVQQQVNAAGTVVGAELLMRWQHPQRGSVSPAEFIPVAEASGLIVPMGEWMIEQACQALVKMQEAGSVVPLSVNVSQRQFRHDGFVERVRVLLKQYGARPDQLILEVTESLLVDHLEQAIARMQELVVLGVRFSIDDFGTGYSSLAYLKRMPIFELKIDKSFVQDTPADPNDTAIVQAILAVARSLDLRVVAEGVETQAQADFLVASQCDAMQGFWFARPEPLTDWLARRLAS